MFTDDDKLIQYTRKILRIKQQKYTKVKEEKMEENKFNKQELETIFNVFRQVYEQQEDNLSGGICFKIKLKLNQFKGGN